MVVGEMTEQADLLVIGGGPAGYTAALRASQLGRTVTLVERGDIGGVCLNVGCIPSKALIELSRRFHQLPELASRGVIAGEVVRDQGLITKAVEGSVEKLTSGVKQLLGAAEVQIVPGVARFVGLREVRIQGAHETSRIKFRDCILATGSRPRALEEIPVDHESVLDSTDLLFPHEPIESLCVIGGGYIGLELGTAYARFGTRVTIVETLDQILAQTEPEIQRVLRAQLKVLGVEVITGVSELSLKRARGKSEVHFQSGGSSSKVVVEKVAVMVGRVANVDEVALELSGVTLGSDGRVKVDAQMRTDNAHIYAVGDIAPGPMLAHKGYFEAKVAAEAASGLPSGNDAQVIPAVVFCEPEVATAGVGEAQAKSLYGDITVGRFPFRANGRAVVLDEVVGEIKVIARADTGRIVGVHMVGPEVSNLISEATLAIELGATMEDIALTIHPHPTLSEAFPEAVEVGLGRPTHIIIAKARS